MLTKFAVKLLLKGKYKNKEQITWINRNIPRKISEWKASSMPFWIGRENFHILQNNQKKSEIASQS